MVKVRFAPSPTGFLHIGGARTYIFNWFFARQNKGKLVLRIDDTDLERSTDESLQSILDGLGWLELPWDEKRRQSDRRADHSRAAEALLAKDLAYRDFTQETAPPREKDEKEEDDGQAGKGQRRAPWLSNPGMRALSRDESERRAAAGEPFVVRFRVPRESGRDVEFDDLVYGAQSRKIGDIEDFALLRSDGSPTYHLASTVDDLEFEITHVIRGQDHLTNTFKHILIWEGLGGGAPRFGHLPLLLGPDGSKLSKRKHGPVVSVTTYRDRGFLPHGFVNYLSLLGWSPKDGREILTRQELLDLMSLDGMNRANAVVTFKEDSAEEWADPKAMWINSQHLRGMPVGELMPYVERELKDAGLWSDEYEGGRADWLRSTAELLRTRFHTLKDFSTRARAYFGESFETEPRAGKNLDKQGARELLHELAGKLSAANEFTEESVEREVRGLAAERDAKPGLIINGARAALTGQSVGPSAFAVFAAIGRDRSIERLKNV